MYDSHGIVLFSCAQGPALRRGGGTGPGDNTAEDSSVSTK